MLLKSEIIQLQSAAITLDKRTIKVSHGESFPDYIKTEIWGGGFDINITCDFLESTNNKMIWFADWYANFIWRKHEDNESSSYDQLKNLTKDLLKKNYSFNQKKTRPSLTIKIVILIL